MGQNKLFSAVLIFLAFIFILQIQSVEGRHLKLLSKKLNTHRRFLVKETAKVVEGGSSSRVKAADADVQSPPVAPLTPVSVVGASQAPPACRVDDFRPSAPGHSPGVCHAIEASDTDMLQPPPAARRVDDFMPTTPGGGHAIEASNSDMLQPPPAARRVDDFRLTAPGHSTGAGHAVEASDTDMLYPPPAAPLAPGAVVGASQAPPPCRVDDVRPKALGHIPGVGHAIEASDTDMLQPPPAAPLAPGAVIGTSQAPPPSRVDDLRPKAPSHSPGVGHALEASDDMLHPPPAAPLAPGAVVGTSQAPPPPCRVDDFRSKAPGHSRGVGHAIEVSDTDTLQPPPAAPSTPSAVVGASQAPLQPCTGDFRPTDLGHGHNLGVGVYVGAADAKVPWYPPPPYYVDRSTFSHEEKVNPFTPPTPLLNPPSHH
ncbi:hypothetical protein SLA2020_132610 [Shorea laevis]